MGGFSSFICIYSALIVVWLCQLKRSQLLAVHLVTIQALSPCLNGSYRFLEDKLMPISRSTHSIHGTLSTMANINSPQIALEMPSEIEASVGYLRRKVLDQSMLCERFKIPRLFRSIAFVLLAWSGLQIFDQVQLFGWQDDSSKYCYRSIAGLGSSVYEMQASYGWDAREPWPEEALSAAANTAAVPVETLRRIADGLSGARSAMFQEVMIYHPKQTEDGERELIERMLDQHHKEYCPLGLAIAWGAKSENLFHAGEYQAALWCIDRAIQNGRRIRVTQPNSLLNYLILKSKILEFTSDASEVKEVLQEAVFVADMYGYPQVNDLLAYNGLALHELYHGSLDKSIAAFSKVFELSIERDSPMAAIEAASNLMEIFISENRLEFAEQWLKRVEDLVFDIGLKELPLEFILRREKLKAKQGDREGAVAALRAILENKPDGIEDYQLNQIFTQLASSEYLLGNSDAALVAIQSVNHRNPMNKSQSFGTRLLEAKILNAEGRAEEALKLLDELEPQIEDSPVYMAESKLIRSLAAQSLGRFEEALFLLHEHIELENLRVDERSIDEAGRVTAKLADAEKVYELRLARQNRDVAEALARREQDNARQAAWIRNLTVLISLLVIVCSIACYHLVSQRAAAVKLRQQEARLNNELKAKLIDQAIELRSEVETRRELELSLERKHRFEALGHLTGGVAHDFNNLLTVIMNSTELFRVQVPDLPEPASQLLDSSMQAASSGANIVSQLLAYARQTPLTIVPIKINNWLHDVSGLFRRAVNPAIRFTLVDQAGDSVVNSDDARLTTAVINLLANANDAIDGEGAITLTVRTKSIKAGNLSSHGDSTTGEFLEICVKDDGVGMTSEQLKMACEPFYTTKDPRSGTGLGLSGVLGFATQSKGDLQIESEVGQGTTVRLLLPLWKSSQESSEIEIATTDRQSLLCSILVVDDLYQVRHVTAEQLRHKGFSVREAADGPAALEDIEEFGLPDIVLSDVRMTGGISGIELRRRILDKKPDARVVLMSGYANGEFDPGTLVLNKPFNHCQLIEILDTCLTTPTSA